MDQFFYSPDGRTLGPVTADELEGMIARREVKPDVPIWASGMSDWSTLSAWTAKKSRELAERQAQLAATAAGSPSQPARSAEPLSPDEVIPAGSAIPPRRIGLGYGLGLLLTAALAALVPILYLLAAYFIARWSWQYFDTGGGTYMQKLRVYGSTFGSSTYAGFLFRLIYYLPAIVGGSIAVFMVVVLIFRRSERDRPMLMNPASQPRLQEVIERLCAAIGAPVPGRIVLSATPNAAAGLARGPSGWLLGRVVLLIGLPLAAALDVRQFIGVLAHEFGHFTQGSGMRLSAFVRALNRRMYDAATEETQIDEYLTHAMTNGWTVISIPVAGIKAGIGLARLGLRVLVRVNHLLSCVLLRQMEFHAIRRRHRSPGARRWHKR
jgi:Zn-dependent protease with chaperone function